MGVDFTSILDWRWGPLILESTIFFIIVILSFSLQWLKHRKEKYDWQWVYQAIMVASVVTIFIVGVAFGYEKNFGGLKDQTLNFVQKQKQKRRNYQADKDTTSRQQITQMVMRQAQKGLEKQGFVAIPSRYILLPVYNDAYTNKGLNAGANYANRSSVDPQGSQKPVMGQGNYGLAGHNFNDGKTGFSALQESNNRESPYLIKGQPEGSSWLNNKSVILANGTGLYIYEITGQTTVDKTQVSVLNPTENPTLTIISCLFPATQYRIITRAALKNTYTWQQAPDDLVRLFNLHVQDTNAHVDWWNPGTEEGANGDAGGTKKAK